MAPSIRPLATNMRLAGVAATVRCVAVDGVPDDHSQWHRGTIEAVDALEPGDVLVASTCEAAFWGELLATASRQRGARGAQVSSCSLRRMRRRSRSRLFRT